MSFSWWSTPNTKLIITQCDHIGRFFKVLGVKLSFKSSPIVWWLLGHFENITLKWTRQWLHIWATFLIHYLVTLQIIRTLIGIQCTLGKSCQIPIALQTYWAFEPLALWVSAKLWWDSLFILNKNGTQSWL